MEGTSDSAALLRLLRVTAIAANEASDIRTAAKVCLDETRKFSGWALGHLYLAARDGSSLDPTSVWSVDDDRKYGPFQELTSRSVMPRGCGLPGRVLASGTPHWIEDVQRDANFPRANAALEVGLHAALAFPILTQNQVSGVLEFFAPEVLAPNESLLSTVSEVGRQLGRVIERQHAADDLRASELRFRSVSQAAPDGIIIADSEGLITFCNRAAERMFVAESNDMIGRPLSMLMPERFREAHLAALARLIAGAESRLIERTTELVGLRSTGQEFPLELSLSSWVAQDRRYVSVIIRDITDRRAAEDQARQDEERVRQSARLHAVGMLAGGIAHDFNNILTAIFGFSKLVLDELPEGRLRDDVLEIRDAAERGAGLTRQLLTFSRQRALRVEAVDPNALLAKLRNMLVRLLPESISLELRLGDHLPTVTADYTQVEQVILNLAVNARDAMPHGGTLVVETGLADLAERQHRGASPGPHVVLTIADSGTGMDAETLARIFEPFFTTKGRMGTGLGLATVYGIVQQTGGSLTVDSTPGQGTIFRVYFPITSVATAPEPGVMADAGTGSETILLVEDDSLIRRSLAKVLRQHGYAVLEAGSASEALTLHHTQLAGTTILLSDVVLPDRDGLSLAKELRTRYPEMRALFMSGYSEEAVQDLGQPTGDIAFLRKPFAPKALVHRLQQLLN
jgi:two-component system cell cycle sensor histidine kinase/response regulator CckA